MESVSSSALLVVIDLLDIERLFRDFVIGSTNSHAFICWDSGFCIYNEFLIKWFLIGKRIREIIE